MKVGYPGGAAAVLLESVECFSAEADSALLLWLRLVANYTRANTSSYSFLK